MNVGSYREAAQSLYRQAVIELDNGDLRQASSNAWRASVQAVKTAADRQGWEHRSRAALFQAVDRLAQEYRDDSLQARFHVANSLHQNSHGNQMTENNVRVGLAVVADLVMTISNL